ncbi:MAG: hypothetical protein PHC41_11885 [Lachnospiraceae bacterium]|nr:hypothetical protein [Lachnospiraceae bacterium]
MADNDLFYDSKFPWERKLMREKCGYKEVALKEENHDESGEFYVMEVGLFGQ